MKMVKTKNMFLATATAVLLATSFTGVTEVEASGGSAVSQISSEKTLQTMVKVDVRSTAWSKGKVFMSIQQGEQVKVVGSKNGWQKVSYKGKTGWVGGHYLTSVSVSNAYKTKNAVDIRESAWSKGKVIQKIPSGVELKVTASKNGWQKVSYKGKTGWVGGHHLEKIGDKSESVAVVPPKPSAPSTDAFPSGKRLNKKEASAYLDKTMENNSRFNSFDLVIGNELALTVGFADETNVNASLGIFKPVYVEHRSQMDEAIYKYAETQTGIRTSYTKNLSNDIKTFLTTSKMGERVSKTYGSQNYLFHSQDKFVRIERK